ncbi:MAG: hypothetical protein HN867_01510 [Deltaproteobacteria bacterium]|jgi:hypothetical protein|nr:hypothetical protein [Deltaproteobacteria bacterium]MBT7202152.1 hypothetical protein [Deltaproteobacteria bacterium]
MNFVRLEIFWKENERDMKAGANKVVGQGFHWPTTFEIGTTSGEYFAAEKIYFLAKAILVDFQLVGSIPPSKKKEKVRYCKLDA